MKVVIVNAYNRHNAGDAALLSALISQVRQAFGEVDICFCGLESPIEYPTFEGARNLGSLRRWVGDESAPRRRRMPRKLLAAGLFVAPPPVLRWLARRRTGHGSPEPLGEVRAIAGADLVIGLGGGYLNGTASVAGTFNVVFLLLPLWLATRLGRPTVLAPQSYGPFGGAVQRRLVRLCLNRVQRIVVREDTSVAQLLGVGVRADLVERGVDSAFALDPVPVIRGTADHGHPLVGITARAWLAGPGQESYERSLAGFADWLAESRGAAVVLIPQVTSDYGGDDDRIVSRRVASYCSSPPQVVEDRLDQAALRALYGGLDYLVGTRFHSVIFGITAGTPALALAYEHKTAGIMGDLGLARWVIPIEEVTTARLCRRFAALEAAAGDYERQLKERLPDYVNRARGFSEVLGRGGR